MDLYREQILDHYQNPRNWGRLNPASCSVCVFNELCGDRIDLYLLMNDSKKINDKRVIKKATFESDGCAISTASCSLLTERLPGKSIEVLKRLTADDMVKTLGVKLTPTRLKCALLPLEALKKALAKR